MKHLEFWQKAFLAAITGYCAKPESRIHEITEAAVRIADLATDEYGTRWDAHVAEIIGGAK